MTRALRRLEQHQKRLDRHRAQLDAMTRQRDELIAQAVDEGATKVAVAQTIGMTRVGVHKCLQRLHADD